MERQQIKIGIADRVYPMKINPSDEEKLRRAVKMINDRVAFFKERYNCDNQDALSMSVIQFVTQLIEVEQNQDMGGLLNELRLLDNQLEEYINSNKL